MGVVMRDRCASGGASCGWEVEKGLRPLFLLGVLCDRFGVLNVRFGAINYPFHRLARRKLRAESR